MIGTKKISNNTEANTPPVQIENIITNPFFLYDSIDHKKQILRNQIILKGQ